jgi:hypothetical protein
VWRRALDVDVPPGSRTLRRSPRAPPDRVLSRSFRRVTPLENISPQSGGGLPARAISRPLLERMGLWRRLRSEIRYPKIDARLH